MNRFLKHAKLLLRFALPVSINHIAFAGVFVTDAILAGRLGVSELAALGIGSSLMRLFYSFITGIIMAVRPMVGQLLGAKQSQQVGHYARQAMWLGQLGAWAFVLAYFGLIERWMLSWSLDARILPALEQYMHYAVWAVPGIALFMVLRVISEGIGHSRGAMYWAFFGFFLNLALDMGFMFGYGGLPAMGLAGCGLAKVILMTVLSLGFLIYILLRQNIYGYLNWFKLFEWPQWDTQWAILKVGTPVGFVSSITVGVFLLIKTLSGMVSAELAAAHQLLLSYNSFVFRAALGLGAGTDVLVAYAVGARQFYKARVRAINAILVASSFLLIAALATYWLRHDIVRLYAVSPQLSQLVLPAFVWLAWFQVIEGVRLVIISALRGYHDTRTPMMLSLLAFYGFGIPWIVYGLFTLEKGLLWIWAGMVWMMLILLVLLGGRFIWLAWKPMRQRQQRQVKIKENRVSV